MTGGDQMGLFDRPLGTPVVPEGEQRTSKLAARSLKGKAHSDEARVLRALSERPDTDDGIEQRLDMRHQTASARRRGLVKKGFVCDSGRVGQTRTGRKAIVWSVTLAGREALSKLGAGEAS